MLNKITKKETCIQRKKTAYSHMRKEAFIYIYNNKYLYRRYICV